jgi:hypothetical protein
MSLDAARAVADAVLYEGYLLYPYRASAAKNRSRWQFGVLGPPQATAAAFGEPADLAMQCLVAPGAAASLRIHLRFLQVQVRAVQRLDPDGSYVDVGGLTVAGSTMLSWEEAVEHEFASGPPPDGTRIDVPGGADIEPLTEADGTVVGRIVRRRWPVTARLRTRAEDDGGYVRFTVEVANEHPEPVVDKHGAIRHSLIGTHLLLEAYPGAFVSLFDPPPEAAAAAARCRQHRCWPVLAGPPGTDDMVLGAPIILYDHPQIAEQSPGALFDSTEIDEILTLRVMTMTETEKAEARATDPRAQAIVDRCDAMSPVGLQRLHGILRDPGAAAPAADVPAADVPAAGVPGADVRGAEAPTFDTGDEPWWDPAVDAAVDPDTDVVVIDGARVGKGSLVRVHPSRRADAQDLFFADQIARVTGVLADVDGGVHVALVLADDPAADLHDWYGRYFYFAPDELEPLPAADRPAAGEENAS